MGQYTDYFVPTRTSVQRPVLDRPALWDDGNDIVTSSVHDKSDVTNTMDGIYLDHIAWPRYVPLQLMKHKVPNAR